MADVADEFDNRKVLERLGNIIMEGNYDELEEVLDPDFVQETPQSGERVRGIANFRNILENYPGESRIAYSRNAYISGHGPHYVMTPTFNVVKVGGEGDELTSYVKAKYPDGSEWYYVSLTSFKDGKVLKRVDFFAQMFDPPEWRSQWVERMDPPGSEAPGSGGSM